MRDSEIKHCQSWRGHCYAAKAKAENGRESKNRDKIHSGRGKYKRSGHRGRRGSENTLQRWVMQYEAEGASAFLPGRREHIYSPKLKLQAVQEYLSGKVRQNSAKSMDYGTEGSSETG